MLKYFVYFLLLDSFIYSAPTSFSIIIHINTSLPRAIPFSFKSKLFSCITTINCFGRADHEVVEKYVQCFHLIAIYQLTDKTCESEGNQNPKLARSKKGEISYKIKREWNTA